MFEPIAHIETDFKEKFGIPRQSGCAPSLEGRIVFCPRYRNMDALRGMEGFSHLWLLFDFSKAHREGFSPTVRPPRLGGNTRMGVFATRSPFRPNPIGLSAVKLLSVEETAEGPVLLVSGADLLDGTPIFDIKPYLPFADCIPEASGGFAEEVRGYSLSVDFPETLQQKIAPEKRKALTECLAQDPRPSYHDDKGRLYKMQFASYEVHFTVEEETLRVVDILA